MKITYKFADGTVSEVEVSDEIGAFIVDSRREEDNYDRKCRYHNYSLDAIDFEGMEYADDDTPEAASVRSERDRQLYAGLDVLTETQRRRLMMYAEGLSFSEIAKREGVSSHSKIIKSVEAAQKILKNFLDDGGRK